MWSALGSSWKKIMKSLKRKKIFIILVILFFLIGITFLVFQMIWDETFSRNQSVSKTMSMERYCDQPYVSCSKVNSKGKTDPVIISGKPGDVITIRSYDEKTGTFTGQEKKIVIPPNGIYDDGTFKIRAVSK